jgi:hypothetical protein
MQQTQLSVVGARYIVTGEHPWHRAAHSRVGLQVVDTSAELSESTIANRKFPELDSCLNT